MRLFSDKNILTFKTQISSTNWDSVFNCDNVNDGYRYLESKLKECYDSSFNNSGEQEDYKVKKLSYRRGTARCVVSVEILPIARQQCSNYLYDKS